MQKIEQILSEPADKDTHKFDKIPANFREKDLPILIELEKDYWEHDKKISKLDLFMELSPIGKQLIGLLVG